MATKRKVTQEQIGSPEIDEKTSIKLISSQINHARKLLNTSPIDSKEFDKWQLTITNIVNRAFGQNSQNAKSIIDVTRIYIYPDSADDSWWQDHYKSSLETQISRLEALIGILETDAQIKGGSFSNKNEPINNIGNSIFLVHGHNEAILHEVARFLEKLNLDITILREQPNEGKTIIEKFETHSDAGFAVVLLTADDKGGTYDTPYDKMQPRARQNVVFEMGYFIGKINRKHVCALYSEGVEIPSDYSGVLYILLDKDRGWQLRLAKEIKAAGFEIDFNKII